MRSVQHKKEAYWFYRFLSIFYDNYVNPFFWTEPMRDEALVLADLDRRDLRVLDVGSGTGFTTLGIVQHVDAQHVTCVDQSPHQMAKAQQKPALQACEFRLGDAENLDFPSDTFDRYVSAGSIEYWPEPQRGITEAYRVLKPGGVAVMIGPLRPKNPLARAAADAWMLFPEEDEYVRWFEEAGFTDVACRYVAPAWVGDAKYGIALVGVKPEPGESPLRLAPTAEPADEPLTAGRSLQLAGRLLLGTAAGAFFIPLALLAHGRQKLRHALGLASPDEPEMPPLTPQQRRALLVILLGFAAAVMGLRRRGRRR